jgi:hypothetical protein
MQIHSRQAVPRNTRALLALGALLLGGVAACEQVASPDVQPSLNVAAGGGIGGTVADLRGLPVAGASVRTATGVQSITDAAGRFTIPGLEATDRLPVTISASGYVPTTRIYQVRAGVVLQQPVRIQPRAQPVVIIAGQGGTVPFQGGGRIILPPRAFAGVADDEPVRIQATYIDPADSVQFSTAPGDFTAVNFAGENVRLESFGMSNIVATGAQGQPVDLAPGQTAQIEFPVRGGTAAATRGLWTFDAQQGTWVESGTAQVTGTSINVRVPSLGPDLNLDIEVEVACIEVRVLRRDRVTPQPNVYVTANGVSYAASTANWTDANGLVQLPVAASAVVNLSAGTAQATVNTPPAGTPGCPRVATLVF